MAKPVRFHRTVLMELVRAPWQELWLVSPRIEAGAVATLLPHLEAGSGAIRVLTRLDPEGSLNRDPDLAGVGALRSLPHCEIRHLPDLEASVYAAVPGRAVVTAAPLTMDGLDGPYQMGVELPDSGVVLADLQRWWEEGRLLSEREWTDLADQVRLTRESRSLGEEIRRVGAFVRVSIRGSRRTRRLDPREYGVPVSLWGQALRPVEVILYRLEDVIRTKQELEAVLAEHGVEWRGYYLVPRTFLNREWPRIFETRARQLQERLRSPEGREAFRRQLAEARRELEAYFAEIYPRAETGGAPAEEWIRDQVLRVLAEAQEEQVLEESGLEYRVVTLVPEDARSIAEIRQLLQDPKLRSVQLTFHI